MIMSLLFVFLIIKYLFVINIEVVHFPQYALLAMLIYPITGNFTSTLIWATLLGILDEGYQYFYLSPDDTGYYDFNDVVTNVVGGAIGLIILRLSGINERHKTKIWKTSSGVALLVLCAVVAFTFTTGFLSLYPSESSSYTLVEKVPESFWITIEHLHKTYHVVSPTEGILMTIGLWIFYSRIGKHEKIQDRIK